jgi:hypothetical protein
METIEKIKELVGLMEVDAEKVYNKGNRSASIRARKIAQQIKTLAGEFRKEILEEVKRHDDAGEN